jgi:spermidine synthase
MEIGGRNVVAELKSDLAQYLVIEEVYTGRPSRVLYTRRSNTAQSGIALDAVDSMLFDYNKRLVELVEALNPKQLLLIGGGVFTLPTYLAHKYPTLQIDVVEPDEQLEIIAAKHFNFNPSKNIRVIHDYGLNYLKKNTKHYDLIILDAYSDNEIAEEILSKKFARLVAKSLNVGGYLAANLITDLKVNSTFHKMHLSHNKYLKHFKAFPASPEQGYYYPNNLVYVAANKPIEISLKYPALRFSSL